MPGGSGPTTGSAAGSVDPSAVSSSPSSAGAAAEPFGARLWAAMERRGGLCAGIDPHPELLRSWGLSDDPSGLERFALTAVEALAEQVALLKPQSAFFERHGSRGIAVLERTVAAARSAGALVLLDVKRGDIGSTMRAYADAYLDPSSPLAADAITVNPYLGFGALRPALEAVERHGTGVFVLAATSNPEAPEVQDATTSPASKDAREEGPTVTTYVLDRIAEANAGARPLGSVGAVVGATLTAGPIGRGETDFRRLNGPVLAPGFGAQGGTVRDLARIFGPALPAVLPATSRGLLAAGPGIPALREAAREIRERLREAVDAAR